MTAKMYEIDKEVASIRVARWPYYYYYFCFPAERGGPSGLVLLKHLNRNVRLGSIQTETRQFSGFPSFCHSYYRARPRADGQGGSVAGRRPANGPRPSLPSHTSP